VFADKNFVCHKKETWLTHLLVQWVCQEMSGCQVSGVREEKQETETWNLSLCDLEFLNSSTPKQLAIFTGNPTTGGSPVSKF